MAARRRARKRSAGTDGGVKKDPARRAQTSKTAGRKSKPARRAPRKASARKNAATPQSRKPAKRLPRNAVTIRSASGQASIQFGRELQAAAMRWRDKLVKRSRWLTRLGDATEGLSGEFAELAGDPAGDPVFLPWLADASLVEVAVPYSKEDVGWEARIAPWEFMLSQLRRDRDGTGEFAVVRYLSRKNPRGKLKSVGRVLYLECAPGEVLDAYSFADERKLVAECFPEAKIENLRSPTLEDLRQRVVDFEPELVHVAGVDTRSARRILEETWDLDEVAEEFRQDGVPLSDGEGWIHPVTALEFAEAINAAGRKPRLVLFNLHHSASRTSALCVAAGTQYSIGFQDTVDDVLAEMLCREFYERWRATRYLALPAFVETMDMLRRAPAELRGTGIVLWSSHSLLDDQSKELSRWRASWEKEAAKEITDPRPDEWLKITVEPTERLNYSLMHNDSGGLFSSFCFAKSKRGTLSDVHVDVEMHVGTESFPYRTELDLRDRYTSIEERIKVPLTSDLVRTVQEPLKTSVFTEVTHGDEVLYRDTHRVTLLPVDEWVDNDENRLWLPSFVLPRDPAVARIVSDARSHLMTLADDRNAGFDGYQSVVSTDPESIADLDLQVQAIWAALVHQHQVRYINPPPSYTETGQRLRTPTQVLRGGFGTCIDLAILLAACLEYVDIYPVIFLLEGHAFVGYWRSEEFYDEFIGIGPEAAREDAQMKEESDTPVGATAEPWIMTKREYPEVLRRINREHLYPLESVGLTGHGSFWEAVDEGVENLRDPEEFHSMIDVKQARAHFLTPLPIIEGRVDDGV